MPENHSKTLPIKTTDDLAYFLKTSWNFKIKNVNIRTRMAELKIDGETIRSIYFSRRNVVIHDYEKRQYGNNLDLERDQFNEFFNKNLGIIEYLKFILEEKNITLHKKLTPKQYFYGIREHKLIKTYIENIATLTKAKADFIINEIVHLSNLLKENNDFKERDFRFLSSLYCLVINFLIQNPEFITENLIVSTDCFSNYPTLLKYAVRRIKLHLVEKNLEKNHLLRDYWSNLMSKFNWRILGKFEKRLHKRYGNSEISVNCKLNTSGCEGCKLGNGNISKGGMFAFKCDKGDKVIKEITLKLDVPKPIEINTLSGKFDRKYKDGMIVKFDLLKSLKNDSFAELLKHCEPISSFE